MKGKAQTIFHLKMVKLAAKDALSVMSKAQQRAVKRAHAEGHPRIRVDVDPRTAKVLRELEVVEMDSRDLTVVGLIVHAVATARPTPRLVEVSDG